MKIEILYKEIATLFGESGHIELFKSIFKDADFLYTDLLDKPRFLEETIDLVFLGPMSEKNQEAVIKELLPYKNEIKNKIEAGQHFLCTGNAMEVFGEKIIDDDKEIETLHIFPYYAKRQMKKRLNCIYLGTHDDIEIIGFKSQFTQCYATGDIKHLANTTRGFGLNEEMTGEGIIYKNFIGTYLIGPLLISNPLLTKKWLTRFDGNYVITEFETLKEAYDIRLQEFKNPKTTL